MRVIPLLLNYYKLNNTVPACMAKGFAAFIRFMRVKAGDEGQYTGTINNEEYKVTDSHAGYFAKVWENPDSDAVIQNILKNKDLWDADLDILPGFTAAVIEQFKQVNKG
jgi:tagaturonate reductase